ncbi:phytanoyl-CoA dioxygenase family protein [Streptomyces sp. NPDC048508]|uniref:phytanoyl-CoA dioxygenase family protein n=1 Tax=Streptomyces sp. NPDC048508 TaxID=3365561 RepID=UPI0037101B48
MGGQLQLSDDDIAEYDANGLLGPYRGLPEEEAIRYRDAVIENVIGTDASQTGEHLQCRHLDSRMVYELCVLPAIVTRVVGLLGLDVILWRSHFWCKQPGDPAVAWHQDLTHWPLEPMVNVTAWLALDEATVENGCVQVIPGSHGVVHPTDSLTGDPLTDSVAPSCIDQDKVVSVQLKPGEFFLFSEKLLHHSPRNTSNKRRLGLAMRMTTPTVKVDHSRLLHGRHRNVVVHGEDRVGLNLLQDPATIPEENACQRT